MQNYYSEKKTKQKKLEYTKKKTLPTKKQKTKNWSIPKKKSFIVFIKYE